MMGIELDKAEYFPGETIRAKIRVSMGKPVKARGVYAELLCSERHRVTSHRVMDNYDFEREKEMGGFKETHMVSHVTEHDSMKFRQEKKVAGEGMYANNEFEAVFDLPPNAVPTSHEFGHDNKIRRWKLRVKLDIPLALDDSAEKEIFVGGL